MEFRCSVCVHPAAKRVLQGLFLQERMCFEVTTLHRFFEGFEVFVTCYFRF